MSGNHKPLQTCLKSYLARTWPDAAGRIEQGLADFADNPTRQAFFRLIALCPRWTGNAMCTPDSRDAAAFAGLDSGLASGCWSDDQLARLLVLSAVQDIWPPATFCAELGTLFDTADTRELAALYRCLPLLREPQQFIDRAREGARSNMVPVFLAIAHHNVFAARHFDEGAWNQLVLKAIFNACDLDPIIGLDERGNPALAHMLCDYVRERWAAGRTVPWDIWRRIGRHASSEADLALIASALDAEDELTRLAAALALRDNGSERAAELMAQNNTGVDRAPATNWEGLVALAQGG